MAVNSEIGLQLVIYGMSSFLCMGFTVEESGKRPVCIEWLEM
jgi:hypothetical protein